MGPRELTVQVHMHSIQCTYIDSGLNFASRGVCLSKVFHDKTTSPNFSGGFAKGNPLLNC